MCCGDTLDIVCALAPKFAVGGLVETGEWRWVMFFVGVLSFFGMSTAGEVDGLYGSLVAIPSCSSVGGEK